MTLNMEEQKLDSNGQFGIIYHIPSKFLLNLFSIDQFSSKAKIELTGLLLKTEKERRTEHIFFDDQCGG